MYEQTILIVDDNEVNQELLEEQLRNAGYRTKLAADGNMALQMLKSNPEQYALVLLDWMMPHMDGMAVLKAMRQDELLERIPVIMQSARAYATDIIQGYLAGASNYLTKPFEDELLLSVVSVTLKESERLRRLHREVQLAQRPLLFMQSGYYTFQTMDQVYELAAHIAHASRSPERIASGLSELLINAIEHGNLGISYQEKTALVLNDRWQSEVDLRLQHPENAKKVASLEFNRKGKELHFFIKDQGDGFDWQRYLDIDPLRIVDPHGRGIAMANSMSFTSLHYQGKGNEVLAIFDEENTL
ncbi:MAG: response regulator [Magnetococcales bacterium]|nr:response regulator [Magnetococcales bacterium]